MRRVLVLNNYPLEALWEEVRRGEAPDHFLYGINHFYSRGYQAELVPFSSLETLHRLSPILNRSPLPLGDIDQQYWTFKNLKRGDIIYAPCQTQTHLLCLARHARLLKNPLVCVAHHPFHWGRLAALRRPYLHQVVLGADLYPALSSGVAKEINFAGGRSIALNWGPDAKYYRPTGEIGTGVVAAGRTGRDFRTFAEGAIRAGVDAEIICLEGDSYNLKGLPHISLNVQPKEGYMNYFHLMKLFNRARVLAIPLLPGLSLAGLTGLMDALAMGKPVICTRHPLIDLDIEKEGIGFWVEAGDVEGWSRALSFFEKNPEEAQSMGKRGRALVDKGLNSIGFAEQIMNLFDKLPVAF